MMSRSYNPRGSLGSDLPPSETPFPKPSDVKMSAGFGVDEADLERGYCEPDLAERPEYDKANYQQRWTLPKEPDEDFANTGVMPDDYEFRARDLRSKGFLTRPRIPTER